MTEIVNNNMVSNKNCPKYNDSFYMLRFYHQNVLTVFASSIISSHVITESSI